MNGEIILKAGSVKRKKKVIRIAKLALLILMLVLLVLYVIVGIVYNGGNFTIALDKNLYYERGIIIYDDPEYKVFRSELFAQSLESFDNISYRWLPNDLNNYDGSHNGENYFAYSFYIENQGENVTDYWSEIIITDVIKNVDEAMRIRVYRNGVDTTYAKVSRRGRPEENTVVFESDTLVVRDHFEKFRPGDINKYTIVIWLEGSDPECTDNILGGEVKIHMDFKSEIIEE